MSNGRIVSRVNISSMCRVMSEATLAARRVGVGIVGSEDRRWVVMVVVREGSGGWCRLEDPPFN